VRGIAVAEVFAADELLLTSSTRTLAITQLDSKNSGSKPGAMFAVARAVSDFDAT
jgi:hypothetical protein